MRRPTSLTALCLLAGRLALAKKRVFSERRHEQKQAWSALNASSVEGSALKMLAELHSVPHDEAMGRTHAVTELPGLPFGYDHSMYAGHVSVHEPTLQNKGTLFYWLVESKHKPSEDPLVIWINGGPGCSSLEGFLVEHGPLLAVASGFDLELNPYAWNTKANVLYIDQPVGTGYASAHDGKYARNQGDVNVMFMAFMRRFVAMHPRYRARPLFLAGESYAGRYIPHFAHQILAAGSDFNLQGVMIGNGWTHPIVQSQSFPVFSFGSGLLSRQQKSHMDELLRQCQEKYDVDPYSHETWLVCERLQSGPITVSGNSKIGKVNIYDVRLYDTTAGGDWPWRTTGEQAYLNRKDVQQALHAHIAGPWEECSDPVEQALTHEDMYPTIEEFRTMLPHIRVLVYNGQFDWICNHIGVEQLLDEADFPGREDFIDPTRRAQWVSGSRLAGYVKKGGNLTFILVLGGSHMVPMDKRPQTYDMLERFLQNQSFEDLLTGALENDLKAPSPEVEAFAAEPAAAERGQDILGAAASIQESAAPLEIPQALLLSVGILVGVALHPLACGALRLLGLRRPALRGTDSSSPLLA